VLQALAESLVANTVTVALLHLEHQEGGRQIQMLQAQPVPLRRKNLEIGVPWVRQARLVQEVILEPWEP